MPLRQSERAKDEEEERKREKEGLKQGPWPNRPDRKTDNDDIVDITFLLVLQKEEEQQWWLTRGETKKKRQMKTQKFSIEAIGIGNLKNDKVEKEKENCLFPPPIREWNKY